MKWLAGIIVVAVLIFGGIMLFNNKKTSDAGQAVAGTEVIIKNFAFSPADLQVKVGDTVTFRNDDSTSHTVTSDVSGQFDSGTIEVGGTYMHKFNTAGAFDYHCNIHPTMKAKIEVK